MLCCRFGSSLRCRRGYLLVNGGMVSKRRSCHCRFTTMLGQINEGLKKHTGGNETKLAELKQKLDLVRKCRKYLQIYQIPEEQE
ncbi:hypothetical protein NC651_018419 [Populus alba x Populus x berolinensis]|nr:hypothetical protein NC651_018419 [Populus alba x Populus x berolinensis]